MKFVGLHAHQLSMGDSIGYPEDHYKYVMENAGDESMALATTDHGQAIAWGYVLQSQAGFKKKGINFKHIFGSELYIHPNLDEWKQHWLKSKEEKPKDNDEDDSTVEVESESKDRSKWYDPVKRKHHLVVLVQNSEGLKNLNRIISWSYTEGRYFKPRADFKLLEKHNKGLMISTACLAGLPCWLALRDHAKGDEAVFAAFDTELKPLLDIFGPERAFLELQFNKLPEQKIINDYLVKYSQRTGYKLISTADSHYARPEWWRAREMYKLISMQSKKYKVSKDDLPKCIEDLKCELYPKNGDQMFEAYKLYNPELDATLVRESIERTYDIAHNQIDYVMPDPVFKIPKRGIVFPEATIRAEANKALKAKGLDQNPLYIQRLEKELDVICKKNYAQYFLVLKEAMDVIQKEQLVGPGRGSGAGSLVCYLLDVTKVDPIKHNLLFERFLSENRADAPDADNDTPNREKTLEILRRTFGDDKVFTITNFNAYQLKSLVKDISKFYEVPYEEVNAVTAVMEKEAKPAIMEENGWDQKLYNFDYDGAIKYSPTFKAFIDKYPDVKENIKILYKTYRSMGQHAGGTVFLDNPEEDMPFIVSKNNRQTPWGEGLTAKHLEQFGIIKYDFLSVATLGVIESCIRQILKRRNLSSDFQGVLEFYNKHLHPEVVDEGEDCVFKKIYHEGNFAATFQFAEKGVCAFVQKAKPQSVSDISAITALWRPGPLKGKADVKYLEAAESGKKVKFDHPILEEILGDTKGLLLYQEQFILLANKLAGFSLDEADELRKLLVKPATSLGEELKKKRIVAGEKFIEGCIANGLSKERANYLWHEEIMGFISYGFNHCLHYEEKITIYDTKYEKITDLPIADVQPGMIVKSRDEIAQIDIYVPVKNRHDHGVIDVYEIELEDGRIVKCTMDHKFRVEDGRMVPVWQIIKENLNIVALDAIN